MLLILKTELTNSIIANITKTLEKSKINFPIFSIVDVFGRFNSGKMIFANKRNEKNSITRQKNKFLSSFLIVKNIKFIKAIKIYTPIKIPIAIIILSPMPEIILQIILISIYFTYPVLKKWLSCHILKMFLKYSENLDFIQMDDIPNVNFYKKTYPELEFEIMTLDKLHKRRKNISNKLIKFHRINFFQIIYISKGSGNHFIDFERYDFEAGDLILISDNQIQSFGRNIENDGYLILFTENFLIKNMLHRESDSLGRLFNNYLYPPLLKKSIINNENLLNIFQEMEFEYNNEELFHKEEILIHLLKIIFLKISRIQKNLIPRIKNVEWIQIFSKFRKELKYGISQTRDADKYAEMLNISYKHLNIICKDITNLSVKKFIDNYIVLEIKKDLATTDIAVKELTYKYGFDEPTNFIKFFKKNTGLTPIQFKDQLKK
ncbi:MAG: hypothetical protein A2086_12230 [Spirochaetes bacterium GWD1_27_9]|nr:MAG: hypothetical protein A2086_12230 [Spirochaetes bacterium GWD1_27_9]